MTPEVKERLALIRQGEVPEGYKMVGRHLAPAEWNESRMDAIYTERKEPGEESLPILTVSIHSGVSDGALDEDEIGKTVKRIEDKSQYKKAVSGDLVFNMMRAWQGAVGTVRTTGMVSPAYIVAQPNETVDPIFMDYTMKTPLMIYTMHSQSYGVTDFRLRLYWDSFAPIKCVLPSVTEQQSIADILTTQDKLIELKEKLLEEKKRQKKYLMQQLLTGKRRLPGFGGEWKEIGFNEVFELLPTNTLAREDMCALSGNIRNIHYGDVLIRYVEILDAGQESAPYIMAGKEPSHYTLIQDGDVVIADTAEDMTVGKATEIQNVGSNKMVSGLHTMLCRPPKDVFSDGWLGYYMNVDEYHDQIKQRACGSKVSSISKAEIRKTKIRIPCMEEQKRIVDILSTESREISLLQQSIDAEKQKKKALMQLLLTGIVRASI